MKIIKSGIEKKFFESTTESLIGYTIERLGELLYIVDEIDVYSACSTAKVVLALYMFRPTSTFFCVQMRIHDGDLITKGAIVDESGKQQYNITIKRYL